MQQSSERSRPLYDRLLKVIIVGVSEVGKSALLLQWTDKKFLDKYESTIGVEFGTKTIQCGAEKTKLQIWDTAGDPDFQNITRSYYRGADIVLYVWDANNDKSITALPDILSDVATKAKKGVEVVFVRNKLDKPFEGTTSLAEVKAKVAAKAKAAFQEYGFSGCAMVESSAKAQEGIAALEEAVVQAALEIQKKESLEEYQARVEAEEQSRLVNNDVSRRARVDKVNEADEIDKEEKPSRYQTIFNHSRDERNANWQASNNEGWLLLQWQSMEKGETRDAIKTKLILMQSAFVDEDTLQRAAEMACSLHPVSVALLRELDDDERGVFDKGRKLWSSFFDEPTESAKAIEERRGIILKLAERIFKKEENIYEGINPKKIPPKVDDILQSNGLGLRK